jgi:hypothetical protein
MRCRPCDVLSTWLSAKQSTIYKVLSIDCLRNPNTL